MMTFHLNTLIDNSGSLTTFPLALGLDDGPKLPSSPCSCLRASVLPVTLCFAFINTVVSMVGWTQILRTGIYFLGLNYNPSVFHARVILELISRSTRQMMPWMGCQLIEGLTLICSRPLWAI